MKKKLQQHFASCLSAPRYKIIHRLKSKDAAASTDIHPLDLRSVICIRL